MTTQNNTAQNPGNDTPTNEAKKYGAPTTSTALLMLFETAADHLDAEQLEYLARMDEQAALSAQSLSSAMMSIGCMVSHSELSALPDTSGQAEIFWNLSHQLETIGALIELAGDARFRLANPKTDTNRKNARQ